MYKKLIFTVFFICISLFLFEKCKKIADKNSISSPVKGVNPKNSIAIFKYCLEEDCYNGIIDPVTGIISIRETIDFSATYAIEIVLATIGKTKVILPNEQEWINQNENTIIIENADPISFLTNEKIYIVRSSDQMGENAEKIYTLDVANTIAISKDQITEFKYQVTGTKPDQYKATTINQNTGKIIITDPIDLSKNYDLQITTNVLNTAAILTNPDKSEENLTKGITTKALKNKPADFLKNNALYSLTSDNVHITQKKYQLVESTPAITSTCHIYTPTDLDLLRNSDKDCELKANIDLSGIIFTPITGFTGNLDGNNHKIINLKINKNSDNIGLFSNKDGGSIKNIIFENPNISGTERVAVLAGIMNDATVTNIKITSAVVNGTNSIIGILIGIGYNSDIRQNYVEGAITGKTSSPFIGGILGYGGNNTISNCYSKVTITGGANGLGFLIGSGSSDKIINSYGLGTINGTKSIAHHLTEKVLNTFTSSYYLNPPMNSDPTTEGGTGLTVPLKKSDFVDWDFDTIWQWNGDINGSNQWPTLR